jgi:hypothetical protein
MKTPGSSYPFPPRTLEFHCRQDPAAARGAANRHAFARHFIETGNSDTRFSQVALSTECVRLFHRGTGRRSRRASSSVSRSTHTLNRENIKTGARGCLPFFKAVPDLMLDLPLALSIDLFLGDFPPANWPERANPLKKLPPGD